MKRDMVVVTNGRHRKTEGNTLTAIMCAGCDQLVSLAQVTDPDEIDRINNPSEEDSA